MNNIEPISASSLIQNDQASAGNNIISSVNMYLLTSNAISTLYDVMGSVGEATAARAPRPRVGAEAAPASAAPGSSAASASDWDPSTLSEEWADMEAAGLCAFLHRLENSGADEAAILWAATRLQAIIDKSTNLDPSIKAIAQQVMLDARGPTPKDSLNAYWVFTNTDGSNGPVATIWTTLQGFLENNKSSMTLPDDDGTAQFLMATLFADFGSFKVNDLSGGAESCFGYYDGGIDNAASCYALQEAAFLMKQGFSTADLKSIAASYSYSGEGVNYTTFATDLNYAILAICNAGGQWPSGYPSLDEVRQDADGVWNDWVEA